jgi:hypothetical protein
MNNIYIIILLLVIIVIIFLLNKNDNFYSSTEDITAKNITASGTIKSSISSPEGGSISLLNPSKTGAGVTNDWTIYNMKSHPGYEPGLNFWRYNADKNHPGPSVTFNDNGNVRMTNDLNIGGVVTAKKFVSADGTSDLPLSREAINNIASVYNSGNLTATNINASNNISATGSINANGAINSNGTINSNGIVSSNNDGGYIQLVNPSKTGGGSTNNWAILNMKAPAAQGLNFWRYNADGTAPGPSVTFNDNGNVNMTDNLTVGRNINANGDVNITGKLYIGGILLDKEKLKWVLNSSGLGT